MGYGYNTFASYFRDDRSFPRQVQVRLANFFDVDLHSLHTVDYTANQPNIFVSASLVNDVDEPAYGGKSRLARYDELLLLYRSSQQRVLDLELDVKKKLLIIDGLNEKIQQMTNDMLALQSKFILLMERFNNDVS